MILSKIKRGCKVGFFGMGKSNLALLSCLPLENCSITLRSDSVIDTSSLPCNIKINDVFEGNRACQNINENLLFFSPSVRRDRREFLEARQRGVIFSSDAEIFFEMNKNPLFAVTGSDGKSTTATLIHLLLNSAGIKNSLIGNIGKPMFSAVGEADFYVAELSSFMLSNATPKAERACITNITPNHLDWHKSFEEYKKTKISLAKNSEKFVISDENIDIKNAFGVTSEHDSFISLSATYNADLYITKEDGFICRNGKRIIEIGRIKRQESCNIKNLMMAIAMTDGYVDSKAIHQVAAEFDGLEHRCKKILSLDGVEFYDSSIDSTPARTVQTLESLGKKVVIILGGRSKGVDYSYLIPTLKKYAEYVILVGENADEIHKAIGRNIFCETASDFETAVKRGAYLAKNVGVLLLSPASTSYDMFNNFVERGEKFKKILSDYIESK